MKFGRLIEYNKRNIILQYISIALNLAYNKNKMYNILDLLLPSYAQFWPFKRIWERVWE